MIPPFGRWMLILCLAFLSAPVPDTSGQAATEKIPPPPPNATCPVCGMFVARYPEWIAAVQYEDGTIHYFDGPKDLYKYLLNRKQWAPDRIGQPIQRRLVTDYYSVQMIDADQAFYVIGSDVLGPMGHELIPLASREDAVEFLHDHKGIKILTAQQITPQVVRDLDRGRF